MKGTDKASDTGLNVEDFIFDAPLGSQGTSIEKLDKNHFKIRSLII